VLNSYALRSATDNLQVNGQNGARADAPAAGQAASNEAEDDSDDDQEEGEGAPDAGAAGG
jgi:methionyl aminopeptidase